MSELSVKQRKKKEALEKRKNRARVSKYRESKKNDDSKLIQFYINASEKEVLDRYKAIKLCSTGEVFKELIQSILKRRLKGID